MREAMALIPPNLREKPRRPVNSEVDVVEKLNNSLSD
jgi:hypothetical protein